MQLRRFEQLLGEISATSNGILLKGDRIVLPESLQGEAIKLAHRGSHPGQSAMVRRLRFHFFFHDMNKVQKFVQNCVQCQSFTDKKTHEPERCWDNVAVDLFGPMPSSRHVIIVQDMASRYPGSKIGQHNQCKQGPSCFGRHV